MSQAIERETVSRDGPRPALGARLRRLVRLVRVRGLRRTLRAATQAYLWSDRRWYLFTRALRPGELGPPSPEFEYREATLADLDALGVFEPNRKRREFRTWLENGALVFVAFAAGRPVAFQCFQFAVPTGPPLSSLTLGPGQIWTVDVQTLPEYRRHQVAASLRSYRDAVLAPRGVREYVSSVQDDNLPALAYAYTAHQRSTDRVGRLSYRCRLGLRSIRIEPDARDELVRFLAAAGALARS